MPQQEAINFARFGKESKYTMPKWSFNCISAISHLYRLHCRRHRHDHLPSPPLAIWIDAICINQEDKYELSHQLLLMGRIYANARETYFWLGEGDPATDKAIEYLARGCLPSPNRVPGSTASFFCGPFSAGTGPE